MKPRERQSIISNISMERKILLEANMLRIFLTGDNHIGLRYAGHETAGKMAAARRSPSRTAALA